MLKKINVADLVLGMYFCGFEAAWIDHPFWKKRFLLKRESDLQQAQASGIAYCWIDISRGLDVACVAPLCAAEEHEKPEEAASTACPQATPEDPALTAAITLREHAREVTRSVFSGARLGKVLHLEQCVALVEEIACSVLHEPTALLSVLRLKLNDEYTYLHSVAVCALMVALGRTLGLSESACREAGLSGYLHDVGKAFIADDILNKPGKLTAEEFSLIKQHPELGYQYLIQNPDIPAYACDVCRHHHERLDGRGYPDALPAASITLYARMTAICDVYDALTSERPYKHGWDPAEALYQMANWEGHFDRTLLLAFVKTLGIYPVGSLVRLESGVAGLVIRQNPADLTRPVLKILHGQQQHVTVGGILDLMAWPRSDTIVRQGAEETSRLRTLAPGHRRHQQDCAQEDR
ncbi:HD-GYP domain-containing protein [uncultured Herbaspirillum sp.]|uniref:HD-GYP domain-containing protein n=1 Tax=uncultured Herbaspirillum sp. TaxID=160236 RepID=UPI00258CDFC4|nr:HD-GYP domain-containing protein [uncultured Herbaspirillum sp.]